MQHVDAGRPEWYVSDVTTGPRWLALVAALVLLAAARQASASAASVAKRLEGEEEECRFLMFLCKEANQAMERQASTPPHDSTELLTFKQSQEVRLRTRDAVEAARIIAAKHPPDEQPWCLGDEECAFLKDALGKR